jgi:heterodisulfide reductase subunit B
VDVTSHLFVSIGVLLLLLLLLEDNIKMDLQEVGCVCVDWIGLAQDRDRWRALVSAVKNIRVPENVGNFLTSCKTASQEGLCSMQ